MWTRVSARRRRWGPRDEGIRSTSVSCKRMSWNASRPGLFVPNSNADAAYCALTNVSLDYDEKMHVPTIWLCLLSLPPSPRPVAFLPQPQADACLGPPRHSSHLLRRPRLPFLRLTEGSRWPPVPAAVVIFPWRSAAQISTVSLVALLSTSLTCPCPAPSPIQSLALRSPCL